MFTFLRQRRERQLTKALHEAEAYFRLGDGTKTESILRALLKKNPHHTIVLNDLGRCLQQQGRYDEALALFREFLAQAPDEPLAHWNMGITLCHKGELEEGFACYRRYAELTYISPEDMAATPTSLAPHHARHAREQAEYLSSRGLAQSNRDWPAFHLADCARVASSALAISRPVPEVEAQWQASTPKIIILDNLLTEDALQRLRQFCLESTVWRTSYADGYIGAMPEHGMGTPLLAQIADELRERYPAIFAAHPLRHYWGFRYDSHSRGIAIHADSAAVNVNFWITPDEANLDPDSGGLVIWDTPAPLDWDFTRYNDDVASAQDYLTKRKATATTIPYRCNRAVIFDSNLFHKTDAIKFKDGAANRRVNITLLYGQRGEAAKGQ